MQVQTAVLWNMMRWGMRHLALLQYRRGGEAEAGPAGVEYRGAGRPGITIGGAEGVTSRFRQPRHAQEERQVADAVQVRGHLLLGWGLYCAMLGAILTKASSTHSLVLC